MPLDRRIIFRRRMSVRDENNPTAPPIETTVDTPLWADRLNSGTVSTIISGSNITSASVNVVFRLRWIPIFEELSGFGSARIIDETGREFRIQSVAFDDTRRRFVNFTCAY